MADETIVRPGRRLWIIVVALLVAAVLALSADVHQGIVGLIALAGPLIARSPMVGALLFVLLSALSALVVFFSGLLLVPIGVQVWGLVTCFVLLWLGCVRGGLVFYRNVRIRAPPGVQRRLKKSRVTFYEARLSR